MESTNKVDNKTFVDNKTVVDKILSTTPHFNMKGDLKRAYSAVCVIVKRSNSTSMKLKTNCDALTVNNRKFSLENNKLKQEISELKSKIICMQEKQLISQTLTPIMEPIIQPKEVEPIRKKRKTNSTISPKEFDVTEFLANLNKSPEQLIMDKLSNVSWTDFKNFSNNNTAIDRKHFNSLENQGKIISRKMGTKKQYLKL
jgi:hypothetical protein